MSSISFSAIWDSLKFNKGVEESGKTVDEFVKHVEKSGGVVTDFANQSAKDMKQSVAVQKTAITELKQQIKELENTTKSGNGTYKQNLQSQGDLAAAKKNLSGEEATLIAMQKQQVAIGNKQVVANNVVAESQVPIIGGLWKWALGLASVGAAMKIGKDIIESTEATSHKFEQAINGSTAAVQYFFKSIASGDWSNFWEGLERSVLGAVKLTDAMEKIERRTIEQEVKGAQAAKDIATLRAGTFDKTGENNAKLITNTEKIIEIQKKDYANQAAIAKDKYDLTLKQMALVNKMDTDKVESLTFEYTKNAQLLELGEKYNEVQKKIGTGGSTEYLKRTRPEKLSELQTEMALINSELQNSFQITGEEAAKLAKQFEVPTIKALKGLADLKKSQVELEGLAVNGSRRDENALAAAKTKRDEAEKAVQKKAKEDAEIENRIKATQEAMKGVSGQKLADLAAGLVLLEKELALRTEIIKQANMSAWTDQFKGQSMTPMTSIGTKPISRVGALKVTDGVLMELTEIDKKGHKTFAKVKTENKELFKNATDLAKKADKDKEKLDKKDEDAAKRKLELQEQILQGAIQLTAQMADQLDLTEEESRTLNNMVGAMSALVQGNYVGAAIGLLSQISSEIMSKDNSSETEKSLKAINYLLEQQSAILANLSGNNYFDLAAKQIKAYNEAIALSTKQLKEIELFGSVLNMGEGLGKNNNIIDFKLWSTQKIIDAYAKGELQLNEVQLLYIDEILVREKEKAELIKNTLQSSLGFDSSEVSDSIFTGIWDGLKLGENALGDFSASFGDLMKTALMKSITEGFNLKLTEGWMSDFTELMKDGLSDEERAKLEQDYIKLIQEEQIKVDEVKKITDKYTTTAANAESSLTGQIKGVSEDTASMIAGRLMKINVDMDKGSDIMTDSLGSLLKIEKNTFDTVQQIMITNSILNSKLDNVISNQVKFG